MAFRVLLPTALLGTVLVIVLVALSPGSSERDVWLNAVPHPLGNVELRPNDLAKQVEESLLVTVTVYSALLPAGPVMFDGEMATVGFARTQGPGT